MPPKKAAAAEPAPAPVQAAPSPAVVAAQQNVEKWDERNGDVAKRTAENDQHLETLATQKANREARLRELFAEVSVIAMPKPPEPEAPAAGKGKAAAGKKGAAAEVPPPPPPPDEDELKRLTKLQNAVTSMYKKKRERPLVRDTPPATADSAASKHGRRPSVAESAMSGVEDESAAAAPAPPQPDEPGIVKPADLDPEIWSRVLKLRDERIDTEEALAGINANIDTAEARAKNLVTLRNLTAYSQNAAVFSVEQAKNEKPPASTQPKPPQTPMTPGGGARRNSNRPPSQLLRR